MRPALVSALLLAGCASANLPAPSPVAQEVRLAPASAQTWRGNLRCGPVPGFSRLPLNQEIEVTVNGSTARYDRAVRVVETSVDSEVREQGSGTIAADGSLTLAGQASSPAYAYSAHYSGMLRPDGGASRLSGVQKWTARRTRATDRNCSMTLRRAS